ncbi:MAG: hypothetical protein MRY21_04845, partial [Simkaniaceae bacterium]|nr:hypothetical protein [Simkaniaceae bacterium]
MAHWNIKRLALFALAICLLYASWLLPGVRLMWQWLDRNTFFLLNSWIGHSPYWQHFWALINHSLTDWVFDVVMLGFFLFYIFRDPKELR